MNTSFLKDIVIMNDVVKILIAFLPIYTMFVNYFLALIVIYIFNVSKFKT